VIPVDQLDLEAARRLYHTMTSEELAALAEAFIADICEKIIDPDARFLLSRLFTITVELLDRVK